jgi:Fe-S cluster biogenesis protein NfuA
VRAVFITSNFVTITKDPGIDWYDVTNILREFIKGFLESGERLFLKSPSPKSNGIFTEKESTTQQTTINSENREVEERIKQMLEDYVRPAVEQDGGAIHFKSFAEGILTLTLKGSCSGCPSSTVTLKAGIENLMKKMVPEVQEVVAEGEEE